jgi:predicted DsbA family dithiol-disulfide isomerase
VTVKVKIIADFICPWCMVGDKRFLGVIDDLADKPDVDIEWLPYELNPDMPPEGLDRKIYRSTKFGSWERSQAMDAHTVEAGRADGVAFNYDIMKTTPNTLAAHRLSWLAAREGKQRNVVDAIFRGYFTEGRNISDLEVLADIAAEQGMNRDATRSFLSSDEAKELVKSQEQAVAAMGVRGVPLFIIGDVAISGAQPAQAFEQALVAAIEAETKNAA